MFFSDQKNNWGIFWRTLEWKMLLCIYSGHLEYFTTTGYVLWAFGNFVVIWYIFPRFVILNREKSGNPDQVCVLHSIVERKARIENSIIVLATSRRRQDQGCQIFLGTIYQKREKYTIYQMTIKYTK
jgi:hypothetical protein